MDKTNHNWKFIAEMIDSRVNEDERVKNSTRKEAMMLTSTIMISSLWIENPLKMISNVWSMRMGTGMVAAMSIREDNPEEEEEEG